MKFRHKLLLLSVGIATLASIGVFVAGGRIIRASTSERVGERLDREVQLLAGELARNPALLSAKQADAPRSVDPSDPDRFADRAGGALGLRVTIVLLDGTVIGDSAVSRAALPRLDNHGGRPEIVAARRAGVGSSTRWSATVRDHLRYLARRIDSETGPAGFVRLAVPVREIERTAARHSARLAMLTLGGLLAVSLVGYLMARRFSRPIERMSSTADEIASGRHDLEIEYRSGDELGQLGSAFNRMTRALVRQIRALSSEKRLRDTILGGMKEGLLVVDVDRHVLLCNDALRLILGLLDEDPTGRPLLEVARERAVIDGFDAALTRGEEFRELVQMTIGPERTFEITVSPLTDADGDRIGAIGLFFDVTRLTALESVRREFVADVSHELRSPLTSVKAFVETLLTGGLEDPDNRQRFLSIVKKHADRMEAILDDLTDLSRIETGAVTLGRDVIPLGPFVNDLLDSLRPRAERHAVTLRSEIPDGLTLSADRRRMEQVLINLIDNAIKFNRSGGRVTVRATPGAPPGGIRIEVEDTGQGIPPGDLERVFNRFYRVDKARSREEGGTGLGLAIVKHLVHLHGGTVRVESEPGLGSRFTVDLPLEPAPPA